MHGICSTICLKAVLELDVNHTGALMLRAQTLVALKEYQCALFDVNRLLELDSESDVYLNLHSRLKTQLELDEKNHCLKEHEDRVQRLAEQLHNLQKDLLARELSQKRLKDEVMKVE
ncbi:hypothetical protein Droror1_Dr00013024 [Drosera rotundifolia]